MKSSLIFFFVVLAVSPATLSAQIYKWVDESGRTHFSDTPVAGQQSETVTVRINSYESVSFGESASPTTAVKGKVRMYMTEWCGYCKRAREHFRSNNIAFTEYDIEKDSRAKREYDALGGKGVPVILVNDKRMNGFSVAGFQRIYP